MGKPRREPKPAKPAPSFVSRLAASGGAPKRVLGALATLAGAALLYVVLNQATPVERLDGRDLGDVFFSPTGEPWVVLCRPSRREGAELSPSFAAAHQSLWRYARFGTLDCEAPLPSGSSTLERFGLSASTGRPVVFVVANGERPKQIPAKALKTATGTVAFIKTRMQLQVRPLSSTADLQRHCLRRKQCLVLLTDDRGRKLPEADSRAVFDVLQNNRALSAVSAARQLSFADALPALEGSNTRVGFLRRDNAKGEEPAASLAVFTGPRLEAGALGEFVARALAGEAAFEPVEQPVTVSSASEESESAEEAAQRERRERKAAHRSSVNADDDDEDDDDEQTAREEERRRRERLTELERESFPQAADSGEEHGGGDDWMEDAEEIEL